MLMATLTFEFRVAGLSSLLHTVEKVLKCTIQVLSRCL